MYAIINLDRMAVTHRSPDVYALFNVAFIENHSDSYAVYPVEDYLGVNDFTDLELRTMYENLTGQLPASVVGANRRQLIQILLDAIERIPVTQIDANEAEMQAAFVEDLVSKGKGGFFRYAYGGKARPAKLEALFDGEKLHVPFDQESEQAIRNALSNKLPRLQRAPASTPAPKPAAPRTSTPATSKPGPKRGTAKAIIWAVADRMWKEAGSPTDKSEVLKLRREIMATLETDEGIKRASSSSELGNWHKDRAPY